MLQNDYGRLPFSFTVNITNEAPKFSSENYLENQIVYFGENTTYKIPDAIDRENQQIKYVLTQENKDALPSFIKFNEVTNNLIISPMNEEDINSYSIQIDLIDSFEAKATYLLKIEVRKNILFSTETISSIDV